MRARWLPGGISTRRRVTFRPGGKFRRSAGLSSFESLTARRTLRQVEEASLMPLATWVEANSALRQADSINSLLGERSIAASNLTRGRDSSLDSRSHRCLWFLDIYCFSRGGASIQIHSKSNTVSSFPRVFLFVNFFDQFFLTPTFILNFSLTPFLTLDCL